MQRKTLSSTAAAEALEEAIASKPIVRSVRPRGFTDVLKRLFSLIRILGLIWRYSVAQCCPLSSP